jgi:hypothetical protein
MANAPNIACKVSNKFRNSLGGPAGAPPAAPGAPAAPAAPPGGPVAGVIDFKTEVELTPEIVKWIISPDGKTVWDTLTKAEQEAFLKFSKTNDKIADLGGLAVTATAGGRYNQKRNKRTKRNGNKGNKGNKRTRRKNRKNRNKKTNKRR